MRLAIAVTGLLAIAATPDGCGPANGRDAAPARGFIVDPLEPACQGHACGDSCGLCPPGTDPKHCPVPTFAATACNARGQCVTATPYLCYEPCAGLPCGAPCHACPPDAPDCAETAVVKACDRTGACRPAPAACP